jgi:hypothetical protein
MDVAATALDQIVQDYAREKQRAEAQIGALRQAWEEESAKMADERKEQDENLKKQRQREIEDYEYRKALERKKAQDTVPGSAPQMKQQFPCTMSAMKRLQLKKITRSSLLRTKPSSVFLNIDVALNVRATGPYATFRQAPDNEGTDGTNPICPMQLSRKKNW